MADSGTTPESIKRRRAIAEAMLMQGMKQQPIEHWTQGLAQMANAGIGGLMVRRTDEREAAERKSAQEAFIQAMTGGAMPAPSMQDEAAPVAKPYGGMRPDGTPDVNVAASHGMFDPAAYMARATQAESGGDPNAANPNSSALGAHQITDETWTGIARNNPHLGLTPDGRTDPRQSALAMQALTQENTAALKAAGLPVNNNTAYAAHFLGAPDAKRVLSADPSVPMAQLVRPDVIKANPHLANMTAGDLANWAASKMVGGKPAAAPVRTAQAGGINPGLVNAMSNPFLPQGFQSIGAAMLSKQMEPTKYGFTTLPDGTVMRTDPRAGSVSPVYQSGPKPTDEMREYELAKQQGFTGSFYDYKRQLKAAGATNVNVGKGENKFDEEMGKKYAETAIGIQEAGRAAPAKIGTLSQMRDAIGGIYTGAGGETILKARRALSAVGIDMGDVSDAEFVQAAGNRIALELRNPQGGAGMPGAMSDKDREFLVSSVPGLTKTPEGNAKLIDYMIAIERRNQQVAQQMQQYMSTHGGRIDAGFYDELAAWAEANPMFQQATPAMPATPALGDFSSEEIEAEIKRRGL